jgi:hypothetical protein
LRARRKIVCYPFLLTEIQRTLVLVKDGNVRECPSLPTDEIACWWEETKISTQLRLAAGVCMLSTGLFIGSAGGAIAAADTETADQSTSTTQAASQTTGAAATAAPTTSTANKPLSQLSTTIQSVLQKLSSLGKPVQKPASVKPTTAPLVLDTVADNTESSEVTAPEAELAASESNGEAGDPKATPLSTNLVASDPGGKPPPTNVVGPALKAVRPVTNAVATVAGVALSVPGIFAALPGSEDPLGDVITSLQTMLVTLNDAVAPLAQVPGDLYSLMVVGMAATPVETVGVTSRPGLSAAASAGVMPPTTPFAGQVLPVSPVGDMPLLGDVVAPATLGGIAAAGLSADLSLSAPAPLAVDGASPTGALSFLEHTVKAVLAPASLTALAAFALPGIGGLLIICAAGIRLGYRQAKAALAVRTSGISRFARQGPLGVVRSGSLVTLHARHPRSLRIVRPTASRATPVLEQAA